MHPRPIGLDTFTFEEAIDLDREEEFGAILDNGSAADKFGVAVRLLMETEDMDYTTAFEQAAEQFPETARLYAGAIDG